MPASAKIPYDATVEEVKGDLYLRRGEPSQIQVTVGLRITAGSIVSAAHLPSRLVIALDSGERHELVMSTTPGDMLAWTKLP